MSHVHYTFGNFATDAKPQAQPARHPLAYPVSDRRGLNEAALVFSGESQKSKARG
jgi:hypothetical protein